MKKIKYLVFSFIVSLCFALTVQASSTSVSISGPSTATVGETVKFNVTLKASGSTLGICSFDVALSNFNINGTSVQLDDKCYGKTSYTYTFRYKVKSSGNATITVKNSNIVLDDENRFNPTASKTIKVISKEEQIASYSDNNNLKNLSVDGYELSPAFSKDILEYTVNVDESTEKINIIATKEDSTASINGAGEINIDSSNGKALIVVTSQKGTTKTYTININVVDNNPIKVNIDGENLMIAKKASLLTAPEGFDATTIKVNDQEVPALYNKKAKITLVGLKNEKGKVSLYIYDTKKDEYTEYKEIKSNYISIIEVHNSKVPNGYTATTMKINGKNITVYQLNSKSKFALIYGLNLETGEKSWYMYDSVDNTLQRYNDEEINQLNKKLKDAKFLIEVLIGGCVLLFILFLIVACKKSNKKKKKKQKDLESASIELANKTETKEKKDNDNTLEIKKDDIKELDKKSKSKRNKEKQKLKEWEK